VKVAAGTRAAVSDNDAIYYQISADEHTWELTGKIAGAVAFTDGCFETRLPIRPLKKGFLHLPLVELLRCPTANLEDKSYISNASSEQFELTTPSNQQMSCDAVLDKDASRFQSFDAAQVYNASAALQVNVLLPVTSLAPSVIHDSSKQRHEVTVL
jgi:hypothetical protein